MKKSLYFLIVFSFLSANSFSLLENEEGLWDVNYISDEEIGGFQFNVDGATVNSASGGDAASNGFLISTSATTVLGFSLSGGTIPSGEGTLLTLDVSGDLVGLNGIVVSDPSGQALDFIF